MENTTNKDDTNDHKNDVSDNSIRNLINSKSDSEDSDDDLIKMIKKEINEDYSDRYIHFAYPGLILPRPEYFSIYRKNPYNNPYVIYLEPYILRKIINFKQTLQNIRQFNIKVYPYSAYREKQSPMDHLVESIDTGFIYMNITFERETGNEFSITKDEFIFLQHINNFNKTNNNLLTYRLVLFVDSKNLNHICYLIYVNMTHIKKIFIPIEIKEYIPRILKRLKIMIIRFNQETRKVGSESYSMFQLSGFYKKILKKKIRIKYIKKYPDLRKYEKSKVINNYSNVQIYRIGKIIEKQYNCDIAELILRYIFI